MRKRIAFAIVLLMAVAVAQTAATSTLEEIGCADRGDDGVWCKTVSPVLNISAVFADDIYCESLLDLSGCTDNCSDRVTYGCYTTIKLEKDTPVEIGYNVYLGDDISEESEITTIPAGEYDSMVNPVAVDLSDCTTERSKGMAGYTATCPVNNTPVIFNGFVVADEEEAGFIIETISKPAVFDLISLLLENLVYIVLVLICVAVLVWAALPKFRKKA
jgi:hypothetical protein